MRWRVPMIVVAGLLVTNTTFDSAWGAVLENAAETPARDSPGVLVALGYGLMWAALLVWILLIARKISESNRDVSTLQSRLEGQARGMDVGAPRSPSANTSPKKST